MKRLTNKTALMAGAFALAVALALVFTLNQSPSAMAQTADDGTSGVAIVGTPTVDYDADDDGLIDIGYPDQLNAMRHDKTGAGSASHADYTAAFPNPATGMGCPESTCRGYELVDDIDLSGYSNWTPIPEWEAAFTGIKSNNYSYSISNMTTTGGGFFAEVGVAGSVHNVALKNATVTFTAPATVSTNKADWLRVGTLVEENYGSLFGVETEGVITYTGFEANVPLAVVGGMVGRNKGKGRIKMSYADVDVNIIGAGARVGGFVGDNRGEINESFSSGDITVAIPSTYVRKYIRAGGFVGVNNGSEGKGIINNSMAAGEVIPNSLMQAFGPGNLQEQAFGPICARGGQWRNVFPSPSGCAP